MAKKIPYLEVKKQLPFLIPEQYNDAMSYQELLYAVIDVVNQMAENVNGLDAAIKEDVSAEINKLINDGTLENIINNEAFGNLEQQINTVSAEVTDINTRLEQQINTVSGEVTDINTSLVYIRGNVFNVKEYGAKGDGVTDDTANIQRCIESAGSHSTIYFPHGVYVISEPLLYYSEQTIIGQHMRLLASDSMANNTYMMRPKELEKGGYTANYFNVFYGMRFDANNKILTSLILGHSTNNKVINCQFMNNAGWHMLEVNSSIYTSVENCYFTAHSGTSGEMLQFDCAKEDGSPGITPYDDTISRYCTVSNCYFEGSYPSSGDLTTKLAGVGSHSNMANCRDILITGCTFRRCWIGVAFRYVIDATVEGCLFHECGCGCWFNYLSVTSAIDRSRYVCVRNNTFYTQKNCVDMTPATIGSYSDRCMISDNQMISVSGTACIPYCDGDSLITGNVMRGTGGLTPVSGNAAVSHGNLINGAWSA